MSKQRIVSNLLVLVSGQLVTWAISSASIVVISRYLGPTRLGEMALATSVTSIFGLVIGLGMETLITRTVARSGEGANVTISAALVGRALLSIPVPLVLLVYVHVAHLNRETSAAVYILAIAMVAQQLAGVFTAALQGHERMSYIAIAGVVQNVLLLAFGLLVIVARGGVIAFAAASTMVALSSLALNVYWARPYVHLIFVSWRDIISVVTQSLSFWANSLFLTFYLYIDSIILVSLAGTRAAGFYSPPTRVFTVALFLPGILGQVTLPMLSRLGALGGSEYDRVGRKTVSLLITSAIPLTIGLATFAGPVILTLFGTAYRPSIPVLVVLSLCIPCTFLNIQLSQMLAARDRQWSWTRIMAASCVANPLINLVLIPQAVDRWNNGALGAALALLATEILMAVYGSLTLREVVFHPTVMRVAVGTLVAGAVQYGIVLLTPPLWIVVGEAIGAVAYLALAITFNALPRGDVIYLFETALRRTHRSAA